MEFTPCGLFSVHLACQGWYYFQLLQPPTQTRQKLSIYRNSGQEDRVPRFIWPHGCICMHAFVRACVQASLVPLIREKFVGAQV